MCRWLAYYGKPVRMDKVLFGPQHSLIEQSLHSRLGAETTNGDGFGIGWYGPEGEPAFFKSMEPAWNDRNLRDLARHVESHLFIAHIRATSGTPVQQSNCHPFRYGKWLWAHNGVVRDFAKVKRDLVLAVDPALFPLIEGSTDSEVLFFLALTLGLEDDPPGAVARMIGLVEQIGHAHERRVPVPGDDRDHRRRAAVGVPLFERGALAHAVLLDPVRHAEGALPRRRAVERLRRGDAGRRVGAARRTARRVERSAGVQLGRRPARPGRDTSVPSARAGARLTDPLTIVRERRFYGR